MVNYDINLVKRAKSGDAHAFARLYEMIYQDLYRFALYTLKNSHDAEDVVSDTVTDAFREIRSLKKPDSFRPWMFRILSNKCKTRLKNYLSKEAQLPEELPSSALDLNEAMDIRNAFYSLNNEERMILSLVLFAGYSSKEVGEMMDMNDNTVRSKQSRALKKMQEFLA